MINSGSAAGAARIVAIGLKDFYCKSILPPSKKLLLVTGSNSSGSSNRTVRDFSSPQLRPRAKTVPRYIWNRPPGHIKPRSDPQLPPWDSRGRFQSWQRLGGVVVGESDDSQVGSGAELLEASASPSWDGFGFSDEHLESTAAGGDWSTVAQFEASLVQAEAPVFEAGELLSVVPKGRESAETTMNQDEAAGPPPADAGAAAASPRNKLLSSQIDVACAKTTAVAARAISCRLYAEESTLTTLITDTEGGKVAAQKALMGWRREAGVFPEKVGRGNRAAVKAPTFTGKPKSLSIYEFAKEWAAFKADSNCTVNEALKELKAAVREADKEVTNTMDTEDAILEHLVDRFGNPIEMIPNREAEFSSWKPCKGTYEQRCNWFSYGRARLQNIIELCTEHEVLDHLYDSQLNRLFQQKLDEDSIDKLMKIFRSCMGKSKSLPKAKLYPCLLALCDEQITHLSTRVTMLANPDTACHIDAQGKGGNSGGSGTAKGGSWKGKGCQGAHTTNQDGRSGGGAVRKGGDGTVSQNTSKKCAFCSGFHPFMFYCEHFIKARVKDRFLMVLKQKSCRRCLTMGRSFVGKRDV
jgi:hypothetical protein